MKTTASRLGFFNGSIKEDWNEAERLMLLHAAEVGPLPFERFKPNRSFYEGLERAGALDVFTMRDDGRLVGYAVFTHLPHPDYADAIWCRESCIYVERRYRGQRSLDFQAWIHSVLRGKYKGCDVISFSTKKHDRGKALALMGFREMETAWILTE